MSRDVKYMADQIGEQLAGTQIKGAIVDSEAEAFGFQVVRKIEGRGNYEVLNVWVMCDAEGNGPGWLSIEEGGA